MVQENFLEQKGKRFQTETGKSWIEKDFSRISAKRVEAVLFAEQDLGRAVWGWGRLVVIISPGQVDVTQLHVLYW